MVEKINLGNDITKVRTRLKSNLGYFEDERTLNTLLKQESSFDLTGDPFFDQLFGKFFSVLGTGLGLLFIVESIKKIIRHPFVISRHHIVLIEELANSAGEIEMPLSERMLNYLKAICEQDYEQKITNSNEKILIQIAKLYREESQEHPDYPLFFALTLRQCSVFDLETFLNRKQLRYKGDFLKFLENICIDFERSIPKKNIRKAKDWSNHQKLAYEKRIKKSFLDLPKGWTRIEGRLQTQEIKKAFSFLNRISEFTNDNSSYLTLKEEEELLKYGIAYPNDEDSDTKKYFLNFDREKNKRLFFYCIYQIRNRHETDLWAPALKRHWVNFLKKRFSNFSDMPDERIKNELRDRLPKLRPEGFEIEFFLQE